MEDSLRRLRENRDQSLQGMVNRLVEEAIQLTDSTIGYFAMLDEPKGELVMIAWSKSAMAACAMMEKPMIYPLEATGLWGDCVRERGPVITNDYEHCTRPTKKGYPDGHVPVKRHLNVPVMAGECIKGILGVGNREAEYSEKDGALLLAFARAAWPMIAQARARATR